jgi:uncharacterized membrane protein
VHGLWVVPGPYVRNACGGSSHNGRHDKGARMNILDLLPWKDWLALASFFALWACYALFARKGARSERTLLAATNRYRARWMTQATYRDPRMFDGLITQTLSNTPSFFCSTTILIIGGLLAVLGTTDKAAGLMQDIPFAQATTMQVLELKLLLMIGIFVYAFFRFSWSMRLYTFVALVIGAMPSPEHFRSRSVGNVSPTWSAQPRWWARRLRRSTMGCVPTTFRLQHWPGSFRPWP